MNPNDLDLLEEGDGHTLMLRLRPDAAGRVMQGLTLVSEGLADMREEHEQAAREQEIRRAQMVEAEARTRALASHAAAARRPRHLQPSERSGPRRMPADARGAIVAVTPVDERTQHSLDVMGLRPRPRDPAVPKLPWWKLSR